MDRRRLAGVLLVVVSAIGFGSGALFAKPVYSAGLDWLTLLVWRFGIGAALAWAWLLASPARRAALRGTSRRLALGALGLGAIYSLNSSTYYAALETVPASLASLIVYIYPVLVGVLTLRIGRPLSGRGPWIALGIATLGAALAVGGVDAGHLPPLGGIALAVASPIIYSGWIVLSARLGGERRDRAGDDGDGGAGAAVASAFMMTATWWPLPRAGPRDGPPDRAGRDPVRRVARDHRDRPLLDVHRDPDLLRRRAPDRRGSGRAHQHDRAAYTIVMAALLFGERLTPVQIAGGGLIIGAVILAQTTSRAADAPVELRLADE